MGSDLAVMLMQDSLHLTYSLLLLVSLANHPASARGRGDMRLLPLLYFVLPWM